MIQECKRWITTAAVAGFIGLGLASGARAQDKDKPQPNQKTQTLTGCLFLGDAVSAYRLLTKDGTWHLTASSKLKPTRHVNHTVTVSGKVIELFDTKTATKEGTETGNRGLFSVSAIKSVSTTCTN